MENNNKVKTLEALSRVLSSLKKKNKTVVFTNGCFDILHYGHAKYLEDSKKLGDCLVVGLNSDSSVRSLKKDKNRPINHELDRASVLASLASVDYIVIFNEPTPLKLISKLKPDIIVKGGDWKKDDVVGKDIVESYGGRVQIIPYLKGYSTTNIIKSIIKNSCGKSR
ncbi:MAG: D-glycero-beta-D-manno-heptose 1-phosphate adenylyltransferase [Candidatus Omnitrophica bacterium]|nr:D-glycero-beta-D-manno-heptose 1-phosphate adenylyltransferase [Candidatus Omnitrophota bacterium]HOX55248.1 D-glycero-beta-D-manno-heptose 1-phosphate adenylyltransferase [Candidatus Omnitrophota bacterium]